MPQPYESEGHVPGEIEKGDTETMRKLLTEGAYDTVAERVFREDLKNAWLTFAASEPNESRAYGIASGEYGSIGRLAVFEFYGDLSDLIL